MNDSLQDRFNRLRPKQQQAIERMVDAFLDGSNATANPESDFCTQDFADEFCDRLRAHHTGTLQPLSKDKFEFALVETFNSIGINAAKTTGGTYPGQDIWVDEVPWSCKTEAAQAIKADKLHISKFKELGKGGWDSVEDLVVLRQGMFDHLAKYDRIMVLRCLSRIATEGAGTVFQYEIVEIPKALLLQSENFPIEFKVGSKQNPVPASCYVTDDKGKQLFELYFDGGTERKLQIRSIDKDACIVHGSFEVRSAA